MLHTPYSASSLPSLLPLLRRHSQQCLRFIICGSTGAVIDLSTLTLLVRNGVNEHTASILSSTLSVLFIFFANKHFTFGDREGDHVTHALKFALVYGLAFIFNISITSILLFLNVHYFLAKVIAIGMVVFWNYSLSHAFIFCIKHPHKPG